MQRRQSTPRTPLAAGSLFVGAAGVIMVDTDPPPCPERLVAHPAGISLTLHKAVELFFGQAVPPETRSTTPTSPVLRKHHARTAVLHRLSRCAATVMPSPPSTLHTSLRHPFTAIFSTICSITPSSTSTHAKQLRTYRFRPPTLSSTRRVAQVRLGQAPHALHVAERGVAAQAE